MAMDWVRKKVRHDRQYLKGVLWLALLAVGTVVALALGGCGGSTPEEPTLPPTIPATATETVSLPTAVPLATPTSLATPTPRPRTITHRVKAGDTLSGLAKKYNTTSEAIMEASKLDDPHMLKVGRELVIPVGPERSASPAAVSVASPVAGVKVITYTVRRGDTLGAIAAKYGVTVQKLMADNDIANERLVQVGQVLIIQGEPPRTPSPEEVEITHIVRPGESLASIATQYHRTVRSIMDANAITSTKAIRVGQELAIPPTTPTPELLKGLPTYPAGKTGFKYTAPVSLSPRQGGIFWGKDANILLNWASVGILEEDEWYLVTLQYLKDGVSEAARKWTKTTSWRLTKELCPPPGAGARSFSWDVVVVRRVPSSSASVEEGEILSPRSKSREFTWN